MLIHKKSRGIICTIPVVCNDILSEVNATVDNLIALGFELDINDWWIVRDGSPLARRIRACYPDFLPITESGELVDIIDLKRVEQAAKRKLERAGLDAQRKEENDAAALRGYASAGMARVEPESMRHLQTVLRDRAGLPQVTRMAAQAVKDGVITAERCGEIISEVYGEAT